MFNSLLSSSSSSSLRLHLADKGACVSLLDPASPAQLTGAERKLCLGSMMVEDSRADGGDKRAELLEGSAI